MKYSIIYGVIRPEISEQLSVGIIIVDGDKISVRYSSKKMNVMKSLVTESEYKFFGKVLRSLVKNNTIKSTDVINYLTRYSNKFSKHILSQEGGKKRTFKEEQSEINREDNEKVASS